MVTASGSDDSTSLTSAATSKGQNKLASVLSGAANVVKPPKASRSCHAVHHLMHSAGSVATVCACRLALLPDSLDAAGSFSGAVVSVCVQPLDVVRTRLQADAAKGSSRSTTGAFRVLVQEQGVR